MCVSVKGRELLRTHIHTHKPTRPNKQIRSSFSAWTSTGGPVVPIESQTGMEGWSFSFATILSPSRSIPVPTEAEGALTPSGESRITPRSARTSKFNTLVFFILSVMDHNLLKTDSKDLSHPPPHCTGPTFIPPVPSGEDDVCPPPPTRLPCPPGRCWR